MMAGACSGTVIIACVTRGGCGSCATDATML